MGANFHSTSTQLLQDALRADGVGASVSLPSEADVKEAEQVLPAEKDGTSAVGAVSNVEAGPDVEEDLLLSKAAEEDDDLCESYEVARLKGGGGGGRWGMFGLWGMPSVNMRSARAPGSSAWAQTLLTNGNPGHDLFLLADAVVGVGAATLPSEEVATVPLVLLRARRRHRLG